MSRLKWIPGSAYHSIINQPWQAVRKAVAGNNNLPLHASEFKRRATLEHFEIVSHFFAEQPFMRFGAVVPKTIALPDSMPPMQIVLEVLKRRIVDIARYWPFRSIVVVFEDNQRANPLVERYFGVFPIEENGERLPVECYFMPKSVNFPALEVADFIANTVGGHARRNLVEGKKGFGKAFRSVFQSVDERLVSFMSIQSVDFKPTLN